MTAKGREMAADMRDSTMGAQLIEWEIAYGFDRVARVCKGFLHKKHYAGETPTKRKPMPKGVKEKMYVKQDGNCNRCGHHFKIEELTDDHIVPVEHGGNPDDMRNRQLLCGECNSSKGSNTPLEESKATGKTVYQQLSGDDDV
jgi:CRISPR/Cas system Type II protein with McrA/HNH and RuvC-like nuclease domain